MSGYSYTDVLCLPSQDPLQGVRTDLSELTELTQASAKKYTLATEISLASRLGSSSLAAAAPSLSVSSTNTIGEQVLHCVYMRGVHGCTFSAHVHPTFNPLSIYKVQAKIVWAEPSNPLSASNVSRAEVPSCSWQVCGCAQVCWCTHTHSKPVPVT